MNFNEEIMKIGNKSELEWFEKVVKDKEDFMKNYSIRPNFFKNYLVDDTTGKMKNITTLADKIRNMSHTFMQSYGIKMYASANELYTYTSREHMATCVGMLEELALFNSLKKNGCRISINNLMEITCLVEIGSNEKINPDVKELRIIEDEIFELKSSSNLVCLYVENSECNHVYVVVVDDSEYNKYIDLNCMINEKAVEFAKNELDDLNESKIFKNKYFDKILRLKRFIKLKELESAHNRRNYSLDERNGFFYNKKAILSSDKMKDEFKDILYRLTYDSEGTGTLEKVI